MSKNKDKKNKQQQQGNNTNQHKPVDNETLNDKR